MTPCAFWWGGGANIPSTLNPLHHCFGTVLIKQIKMLHRGITVNKKTRELGVHTIVNDAAY